jgi:uncharacterized protein (TIGR03086 family)
MTETADRFRTVADGFSARVAAVPADAWDNPSPCPGWTARDIVAHLEDTARSFLGRVGLELPPSPSVMVDPVASWEATRAAVQGALDDPATASLTYEGQMGTMTLDQLIGSYGVGDVLVHTWDLARAAGLDEHLDPDEVHRLYGVMEQAGPMLRQGNAFGPPVEVPAELDEQAQLLAFTGRDPR